MMAASADHFGFYDKLCLATERVKMFNHLFLERQPKYLKNDS